MFKISGNRVNSFVELIEDELNIEVEYLISRLALEKKKLIKQGMTSTQAELHLSNLVKLGEGYYKTFATKMTRIISESMKQAIAQPVRDFATDNPKQLFAWVLGSVKTSHCGDCENLSSMEPMTIDDWLALGYGLPRDGLTECNVGCQCMIQQV